MNAKDLLLKQTSEAFSEDEEMSLKASLCGLAQEEATWRLNDTTWTIEEILYHVASCKLGYCQQAFGNGRGRCRDPKETSPGRSPGST